MLIRNHFGFENRTPIKGKKGVAERAVIKSFECDKKPKTKENSRKKFDRNIIDTRFE